MPAFTNMAWPEDPYGTGQLWRREPPLLAAFSVLWPTTGTTVPAAYAVAYLRLHRTQPVDLSEGVGFGFRAVVAATSGEVPELVRLIDLDALRARRLAKVVAGYCLAGDLQRIGSLAAGDAGRGVRGLADAWAAPGESRPGLTQVFDLGGRDGYLDLAAVAADAGILAGSVARAFEPQPVIGVMASGAAGQAASENLGASGAEEDRERCAQWLAACATERALVCAVTAGRMLGRHTWDQALDIGAAMAANAWDCYSLLNLDRLGVGGGSGRADGVSGGAR